MKVTGKISSITAQQNPTCSLVFAFNQIGKLVLQFSMFALKEVFSVCVRTFLWVDTNNS